MEFIRIARCGSGFRNERLTMTRRSLFKINRNPTKRVQTAPCAQCARSFLPISEFFTM
jgi:hypothetical protein